MSFFEHRAADRALLQVPQPPVLGAHFVIVPCRLSVAGGQHWDCFCQFSEHADDHPLSIKIRNRIKDSSICLAYRMFGIFVKSLGGVPGGIINLQ